MDVDVWRDRVRMPTLDAQGSRLLKHIIDQPYAPKLHNCSGSHLSAEELCELTTYHEKEFTRQGRADIDANPWLSEFVDKCLAHVPFYRQYQLQNLPFHQIPTIYRADLSEDIAQFVPDHLPIDRLLAYQTSGTTGHPLTIPSHPTVAARYSCFHKKALLWNGVDCADLTSDLAIILAGYQKKCFTYASISPYLNNKALAKLNFHPSDWSHPADREKYLDANKPDLISGDPISLMELAQLQFSHQPRAMLSTSMTLLKGTRKILASRFGCPILDLYSLNEAGPVGTTVPGQDGFKLLQSEMLVEVLDAGNKPLPPGMWGEITLTGGFNHYLPLLRYRTGDYGRLEQRVDGWYLLDLEGRPPVCFQIREGEWLNNVDVTHFLEPFALTCFSLHQHKNGSLSMNVAGLADRKIIKQALEDVFHFPVTVDALNSVASDQKLIQYTSARAM